MYKDQYSGHCIVQHLRSRYNSKFEKKNLNVLVSSIKSLRRETQFFSYKFSVLKFELTAPKCTRMHHFDAIFQKFRGEAPRTPTCGRWWTPPPPSPFRRFAPLWSLRLHALVLQQFSIVLQRKKSWTPLHFHGKTMTSQAIYLWTFINVFL